MSEIIIASSAAVYAYPDDIAISEDASVNPTLPYGLFEDDWERARRVV
jgi:UDP-glucose 4-epimerase